MATVQDLPASRAVAYALPVAQMRKVCELAIKEWGAHAADERRPDHTVVRFWTGGRAHGQRPRPVGGFSVRWFHPSNAEATVDRIEWDPAVGGSEEEVRQVLNALAGWPVAR